MPGSQREVANAEEEGVRFNWLSAPQAFIGDNTVRAVQAQRIHLGQPDATGRQVPQVIEGSGHELPADLVIKALGFDPENIPKMFGHDELGVTKWGTLSIDWRTMMTSLPGVFAAGDIVRGASLVVWGVRDGRDAAEHIDQWIIANADAVPARAVSA
jgi:glutamate synthase (NADPH/NADH) small chain